jgi:hypothetical protein
VLRATIGEAGIIGEVSGGAIILGEGFWPGLIVTPATGIPTEEGPEPAAPLVNTLRQNVPNPFRSSTVISYTVGRPSPVTLGVYDVTGRSVASLANHPHTPGIYHFNWNGRDAVGRRVASGVYFYRLEIGDWSITRKLLKVD